MIDPAISWPSPSPLLDDLAPPGARWFQPARADVARIVELVHGYADIEVGLESCHRDPDFYERAVQLRDVAQPRTIFAVCLERGSRLVALATFEYQPSQRLLAGRLAMIAPEARGDGLGSLLGGVIPERIGRAIGAEILLAYVTLRHQISQRLLCAAGYRLAGVVPGHDRDQIAPGVVKRVWEALYVKLLVDADEIVRPDANALLPETAALIAALGL